MTRTEQALTGRGYANLTISGDKIAGLHWLEHGVVGMYCGLKIDAEGVTWEHEREFRGDAGLDEAKAALVLWKMTQVAATKALQASDLD